MAQIFIPPEPRHKYKNKILKTILILWSAIFFIFVYLFFISILIIQLQNVIIDNQKQIQKLKSQVHLTQFNAAWLKHQQILSDAHICSLNVVDCDLGGISQLASKNVTGGYLMPSEEYQEIIKQSIINYAEEYNVDTVLALRIAWCESGFKNVANVNGEQYGAGIFQFIRSTWEANCDGDVWHERDNIQCAMKLLANGEQSRWGTATTSWGSYQCWKHLSK